jgi:hypothetical protein
MTVWSSTTCSVFSIEVCLYVRVGALKVGDWYTQLFIHRVWFEINGSLYVMVMIWLERAYIHPSNYTGQNSVMLPQNA